MTDSIRNSFRCSNKRHLIITGGRGTGKSTLLRALFPQSLRGITTAAEPKKAVYLWENGADEKVTVGRYDDALPGTENKMRVCRDAFETAGCAIIKRLLLSADEWVSVDEIGYLETACPAYCDALERLFAHKRVAAVVRGQALPFLQAICAREDVFVVDLDDPFGDIACVIMASGMGRRFGGNKLMADFCGTPMICRAIEATDGIFSRRVVVTRHTDVAALCDARGIACILHDLPHRNDTVRLGLEAVSDAAACVFCPGDQPLLRRETVMSLALCAKNDRDAILRVCYEDTPGAPVLFPRWTFAELGCLPVGVGGGYLIKKYPHLTRTVPAQDGSELADADTPEALAFLARQVEMNGKFQDNER